MKRIVRLRIDHLRLDRGVAGLTTNLQVDLAHALQQSLTARQQGTAPDWSVTTSPGLRQAADHLAAALPLPSREGGQ